MQQATAGDGQEGVTMTAQARRFWTAMAMAAGISAAVLPWPGRAAMPPLAPVGPPALQDPADGALGAPGALHVPDTRPGAAFTAFRDPPPLRPVSVRRSADMWAEKLLAIGAVSSYGSTTFSLEQVLRTYAGGEEKFAALFAELAPPAAASGTNDQVARCESWACGAFESSIPGVALPLVFAVIALFAFSRIRRKRVAIDHKPAEAAS